MVWSECALVASLDESPRALFSPRTATLHLLSAMDDPASNVDVDMDLPEEEAVEITPVRAPQLSR